MLLCKQKKKKEVIQQHSTTPKFATNFSFSGENKRKNNDNNKTKHKHSTQILIKSISKKDFFECMFEK